MFCSPRKMDRIGKINLVDPRFEAGLSGPELEGDMAMGERVDGSPPVGVEGFAMKPGVLDAELARW